MNNRTYHYTGFWDGYRKFPRREGQAPAYNAGYDAGSQTEDIRLPDGTSAEYIAWEKYRGFTWAR